MLDIKNKSVISEGLILLFISAGAYLFSFSYESGYLSYFNIPNSLIKIRVDNILIFGTIFSGVLLSLLPISNLFAFLMPKKIMPEFKGIIISFFTTLLYAFMQIILFGLSNWIYWIYSVSVLSISVLFIAFFSLVFPLLSQRKVKGYINKLKAQNQLEAEVGKERGGVMFFIDKFFGKKVTMALIILLIGSFLSRSIGLSEAVNKQEFLITNPSPEQVILRIYGDDLISARFNRTTRRLDDAFQVLKLTDDHDIEFHLENVGPLITSNTK